MSAQTLQWIATAIVIGIIVLILLAPKLMWWILIVGGSLCIVAAAVYKQGIPDGLAGGLFLAGIFALLSWFRYKKVARDQQRGRAIMATWLNHPKYPVICERCGAKLSKFLFPRTFTQLMWGGWTCPSCGAELDGRGKQKISQA